MLLIYLAAPYSYKQSSKEIGLSKPDVSEKEKQVKMDRFEKATVVAGNLQKLGHTVFSPITHSHNIHEYCDMPGEFSYWEQHDYNMINRCDILFVLTLPGWKQSEGVQKEIYFAQSQQKPIFYIDENLRLVGGE